MATVDHTGRDHALLSASGASRWMACPPSARLEEKALTKDTDNIYAQEGTLAHELSDILLQERWKGLSAKGAAAEKRKITTAVKKLFPDDHALILQEMEAEVQKYVDIVSEAYSEALKTTPDAVLLLEERLDYSHIVEQGFGTGDAIIIGDGLMDEYDLKYGKGIVVDAKLNPQLMLYANGALRKYDMAYDIQRVRLNIVQPRLDNFSSWETSVGYIENWAEKVVRPAAKLAFAGEGEKKAGDHCKWCKVKPICRAVMDYNLEIAKHDFKQPEEVSIEELAGILDRADMFTDWLSSVKSYLMDTALSGKFVPGYKLVEGRSNRRWADEEKVKQILEEDGYPQEEFLKMSLEGITKIEKLVGKDEFNTKFGDAVIKPQGSPTLVPLSDRRPAMGLAQAKEDFA